MIDLARYYELGLIRLNNILQCFSCCRLPPIPSHVPVLAVVAPLPPPSLNRSWRKMGSLLGNLPSYDPHNFSELRPADPSAQPSKLTPVTYHPTHNKCLPPTNQVISTEARNILLRHFYQKSEEKETARQRAYRVVERCNGKVDSDDYQGGGVQTRGDSGTSACATKKDKVKIRGDGQHGGEMEIQISSIVNERGETDDGKGD
ncbi:hypothetical protein Cni_G15018 [Canna indica]|uniref:DET1- and DDB1-associated protein 1 domain-containing protein n=1 Tax=Canna indica TaxID=4628 RepID=A0AAQ3QED4_9LILI|nr:hypothetical protein Cni_G15018 [Canna indica]